MRHRYKMSRGPWLAIMVVGLMASHGAASRAAGGGHSRTPGAHPGDCLFGNVEGAVRAGEGYEQPIGNGLKVLLEPLRSGWLLRVLPAQGPRGEHDYAELATLPYRSVSPLLVSTDFSFRAQDALAWNPRRFRFAADKASFATLLLAYREYQRAVAGGAGEGSKEAEARLEALVARTSEGELTILDAHLEEGTGDEGRMAEAVAQHPNLSAQQVDRPANGASTPLGRLNWIRFHVRLSLPPGFEPDPGLQVKRSPCH